MEKIKVLTNAGYKMMDNDFTPLERYMEKPFISVPVEEYISEDWARYVESDYFREVA